MVGGGGVGSGSDCGGGSGSGSSGGSGGSSNDVVLSVSAAGYESTSRRYLAYGPR